MRPAIRYIFLPIGVIALGLGIYIAILMFVYLRALQTGSIEALPQFTQRFTKSNVLAGAIGARTYQVVTADDPAQGPLNAPLTIVEFADFECPFSKEVYGHVRELAAKYPDKVRVIFRDFPLSEIHPNALPAARAGNCAEAQGKFWQMHDKLFSRAPALAREDLARYADEIGLDRAKFDACMSSPETDAEVQADFTDGVAAGIRGTPTFFFNGRKVEGAIPRSYLNQMVEQFVQTP